MRFLINTKNCELEEIKLGQKIPEYAILSHTWRKDEVSYQDYLDGTHKAKKGFKKIEKICEIASKYKIKYAWVDTCCIDKKSSAELTEAINSMFSYYEQSKVCYTFLDDLAGGADLAKDLKRCRWFTRGWTLQELIAPKFVLFFDQDWKKRGSKTWPDIAAELSSITSIGQDVLRNERPLTELCVAQKLSWAAHRTTTRIEDSAYCLFGLLGINMPLLYGEGENAFRRLQDEIIRSTADLSIFAWNLKTEKKTKQSKTDKKTKDQANDIFVEKEGMLCGVLARSPAVFSDCSDYMRSQQGSLREFSVTNVGVTIRAQLVARRLGENGAESCVLPLNCTVGGRALGLRLRQVGYDEYLREDPFTLIEYSERASRLRPAERVLLTALPREMFPPTLLMEHKAKVLPPRRTHMLQIQAQKDVIPQEPWPADRYDIEDQAFFVSGDCGRDFGTVDIDILIRSAKPKSTASSWVQFRFCALGWSSKLSSDAQFGVVDVDQSFIWREIRPQMTEWDRNSKLLAYYLNLHGIPKTSTVRYSLPKLGCVAHVTFDAKVKHDLKMSLNPLWTIKFSYTLHTAGAEPSIAQKQW